MSILICCIFTWTSKVRRTRYSFQDYFGFHGCLGLRFVSGIHIILHCSWNISNVKLNVRLVRDSQESSSSPSSGSIGILFSFNNLGVYRTPCLFSFVSEMVNQRSKVNCFRSIAFPSSHVRSTSTLTSHEVTVVIISASVIAVTRLTSCRVSPKTIEFGGTLITVSTNDIPFADTFSTYNITSLITNSSELIARARLATEWIFFPEVPIACLTFVTSSSLDVHFAVTVS